MPPLNIPIRVALSRIGGPPPARYVSKLPSVVKLTHSMALPQVVSKASRTAEYRSATTVVGLGGDRRRLFRDDTRG